MMMTAPIITTVLNTIVLGMPRPVCSVDWFVPGAILVIVVLTAVLIAITIYRALQGRKVTRRLFIEQAEKTGLSEREREILDDVANHAGLNENESIFTMADAFERGTTKMMGKSLSEGQAAEGNEQLKTEISFLREKLGFLTQPVSSISGAGKRRKLSSRQIPVGKKLHMTRRKTRDSGDIETTVIENNDVQLKVRCAAPVKVIPGEIWRVRYYFGASVWEFDVPVVGCDGDVLVLGHSDNVRFINRRRFLRVPVNKPAFIARFPFTRTPVQNGGSSGQERSEAEQDSANASSSTWGPPEFIPAIVTQLAGPGLRIEVPLEVEVGERVLLVIRLDEEKDGDSIPLRRIGTTSRARIVEDIGEVRHVEAVQNGWSIAVELTGLSDSDLSELVRVTNAASLKTSSEGQDAAEDAAVQEESVLR
jgi:hypothetical protein